MSKIEDLANAFDQWMKNYNHHGATHGQSFRDFITSGHEIEMSGTSYDEYVALAFLLNRMNYSVEWVVPYEQYQRLVEEARQSRTSHYE